MLEMAAKERKERRDFLIATKTHKKAQKVWGFWIFAVFAGHFCLNWTCHFYNAEKLSRLRAPLVMTVACPFYTISTTRRGSPHACFK